MQWMNLPACLEGDREILAVRVFDAPRELMTPPDTPKRPIGFITPEDKGPKTAGARDKT